MPLSISLIRLPHLPPTTAHLPHTFLPSPSLKSLSLTSARRKPTSHLSLTHCQPQATETQTTDQNEQIELPESEIIPNNTRVLIQNFPWNATADDLRLLVEPYGTVVNIDLVTYSKGRNRGLAFVSMSTHEEAAKVLENLESMEFQDRVLRVNWAIKPKPVKTPSVPKVKPVHNVFVANLAFSARSKDLRELFSSANAVSAEVIFDPNRRATGYGFVSFNTKEESEAAIEAFNEKEFMGRQIRVARSKRFLRQSTKKTIEAQAAQAEAQAEVQTASVT